MVRKLTRQEKKIRSYQRDGRNPYGENDKSSRKNIPKGKAIGVRSYHSRVRELLRSSEVGDVGDAVAGTRRPDFRKEADVPLSECVQSGSELRKEAQRRGSARPYRSGQIS